jgi:hypothetical protein
MIYPDIFQYFMRSGSPVDLETSEAPSERPPVIMLERAMRWNGDTGDQLGISAWT